jgi:hypothetical protein
MNEIKSNFEFKDERAYVHSSTICDEIINRVLPQLMLDPSELVLDAKFHRFFSKDGTFICQEQPFSEDLIGGAVADFRLSTPNGYVYVLLRDDGGDIHKRSRTNYGVADVELLKPYTGIAKICMDGYSNFFLNIIEANKRIHLMSSLNGEAKVINVYMKKLQLDLPFDKKNRVLVNIENLSARKHLNGLMTLNRISFMESNISFDICYFVG